MKRKIHLIGSTAVILFIIIACQVSIETGSPTSTPEPTPTPQPAPTVTIETPTIPDGWLTYQNTQYGFEISYPPSYQALDDANNLYGWPNGIVLLYNGGQSYDIAIQAWNNEQEMNNNYPNAGSFITGVPIGDKVISIFNVTQESENPAIIATFRLLP